MLVDTTSCHVSIAKPLFLQHQPYLVPLPSPVKTHILTRSPSAYEPDVNEDRITASVIYNKQFGEGNNWATTFAWGRKMNHPGHTLDGFLLESAVVLADAHTVFGRAERVNEDELLGHLEPAPVFTPTKFSVGYIYDFHVAEHVKLGIGGLASHYIVPKGLDAAYGSDPTSFMTFVRLKIY